MKRISITLFIGLLSSVCLQAQDNSIPDSSYFISLNRQIDNYVVQRNVAALDTLYAEDFVFSHGTGLIEGKASWLKVVNNGNYPLRQHDSMTVELHPGVAIIRGKLSIQRIDKGTTVRYHLKYVRLFAVRNKKWQLISHITTQEQHEH